MQLILIILLVVSAGAAVVFAISLRKYQNKVFEQAVEHKKALEDNQTTINLKEQEIENDKAEIERLTTQINEFESKKEQIFNDGVKQGQNESAEFKKQISEQKSQIKSLQQQVQELKTQSSGSNKLTELQNSVGNLVRELIETIAECIRNNMLTQKEIAHNKNITLLPNKVNNEYYLSFDDILTTTTLTENEDYLIDRMTTDDGLTKCHYTVFIIANETVVLVDNKLAVFFEENLHALKSNDSNIIKQVNSIIDERIKFLSNKDLHENIKSIVSSLETVVEVTKFIPGIYLPSETIFNDLLKEDFDFFRKINQASISPLVPASIVSIIKSAETAYLLEDALVNYKIAEDIAQDIENLKNSASNPDEKPSSTTNNKAIPEDLDGHDDIELSLDDEADDNNDESNDDFGDFLDDDVTSSSDLAENKTDENNEDDDFDFDDDNHTKNNSDEEDAESILEEEIIEPKQMKKAEDNFSPEINIDQLGSEEMSDQNTDYIPDANSTKSKSQAKSGSDVDQFDIGGFLDGIDDDQDSKKISANKSKAKPKSSSSSDETTDIDDFLKD